MIIGPSFGDRPRYGKTVRMSARRIAATVPPKNVVLPPARDAPPRTAAVMLLSANADPTCGLPIGDLAMTKNEATAASTAEKRRARTRIQLVPTPPRFADRSSNPTARSASPDPDAWSHTSARIAPATTTMNAKGIGPIFVVSAVARSGLMTPWAVGRNVSEIPSRMLSVARVAMIDGTLSPRIRPALTRPRATPQSRMTPAPITIWEAEASAPIRKEAMTTPRLIMPPTDRSRYPTRSAWFCAMAATIRGSARIRIWEIVVSLMKPGNREFVYPSTIAISRICSATGIHRRNRTILRHLFLSRASRMTFRTARRTASVRSLMAPRVPSASRPREATAPPWTARVLAPSPRRCAARRARRPGSPR